MGRSVSYANGSEIVEYIDVSQLDEEFAWDDYIEYLTERIQEKYPSLTGCEEWLGNEDKAILENELVYIGVSEYCGLMSLWVQPKEDENGYTTFGSNWCSRIAKGFNESFGEYNKIGTFSNGESIYENNINI